MPHALQHNSEDQSGNGRRVMRVEPRVETQRDQENRAYQQQWAHSPVIPDPGKKQQRQRQRGTQEEHPKGADFSNGVLGKTQRRLRFHELGHFYAGWEMTKFMEAKTPLGFAKNTIGKIGAFWMFFLGPALTLPLLFLPWIWNDRRMRPLLLIGAVFLVALGLNTWFYAHYAAPITGLIFAVVLQGMRHLRVWRRGRQRPGILLARAIPLVCLAMVVLRAAAQPLAFYMPPDWPMTWYYTRPGNTERARIAERLKQEPGRQLAIVRYAPGHN